MRALRSAVALERLASLPPAEAGRKLQTIPGIGIWTAAEVLQRTHGCPDSIAIGDYHLASFVGFALTGRKTDDAGMIELLRPWAGHRQRVVRLLGLSGFRKPAFGPRMTIQDHRGH
jgi:3-methyladenine DNA glycosylase/8-oxoguanine DNA glycosylase